MIYSMTAYARTELKAEWGNAFWEMRSVNQRYLESFVRLPESLRSLEPIVRERLKKNLNRGKIEIQLKLESNDSQAALSLNTKLAEQLINTATQLKGMAGDAQLNIADIMRWPGVLSTPEQNMDAISNQLLSSLDELIKQFIDARGREGEAISNMLTSRLDAIDEQIAVVRKQMPEVMAYQREKLQTKLSDFKQDLDPARLEQEMIILAQKQDVAEEMDRLEAHVAETKRIIKKGGACGRRLDFMMQEFNRESNTLASKSISTDITNAAIELKVLIEQMREQIQNLE